MMARAAWRRARYIVSLVSFAYLVCLAGGQLWP